MGWFRLKQDFNGDRKGDIVQVPDGWDKEMINSNIGDKVNWPIIEKPKNKMIAPKYKRNV